MKLLTKPTPIYSLVFFRIIFGLLAFGEIMGVWIYYHLIKNSFSTEGFRFHYYGFRWAAPFPEPFMSIFFIGLLISAILIFLGKWYRLASIVFAVGFIYLFLINKAHYLNHGYLFCWIATTMIFLPANRAFSLDAIKKPSIRKKYIPFWMIAILPFYMSIVYFFGGIAKINSDWLQAIPLLLWLEQKNNYWLIGPLVSQDWVAWLLSYGGLIFDLSIVFFLLSKRTRTVSFFFVLAFHFINSLLFGIGIFPALSVGLTALFFSPDFPVKILAWVKNKKSSWATKIHHWEQIHQLPVSELKPKTPQLTKLFLLAVVIFHLVAPLRHHLFKGDVAWTEEGHRYAWRMMLRSKSGYGYFTIKDKKTPHKQQVFPKKYMESYLRRKLFTHPDMILEFAHHLGNEYKKKGWDPDVRAVIYQRLNGGDRHLFIDTTVNLFNVPFRFFETAKWVNAE